MALSIRSRLTLWYAVVVGIIVILLGLGVYLSASWSLQRVTDRELDAGIDNIIVFLRHKYATHDTKHLADELREHSSLLPRGKLSRIGYANGPTLYQSQGMQAVPLLSFANNTITMRDVEIDGRPIRYFSRVVSAGPDFFLIEVGVDQSEYLKMMHHLAWLLALSIPLAAVFAALGGYWMSGRALNPIHRITRTASQIDAQNLAVRLPIRGTDDELDFHAKTLNQMFDRIESAYARVTQFTADASHELRTPVALIQSNAEYLLMGGLDEARADRSVKVILKETGYMTRLIGDLLTLARADRADVSPAMEVFELEEAFLHVVASARTLAFKKSITVDYQAARRIVAIQGDRSEFQRLAMIFIDNAVLYSPEHSLIGLTTWATETDCGFSVADRGIGIAEADQERIFQRFYRVDPARSPNDSGTGLGLAIAKSLIATHHGRVTVQSQLGNGSCFTVSLPRADSKEATTDSSASLASLGVSESLSMKRLSARDC
jgi:signal transduction histidine kinase